MSSQHDVTRQRECRWSYGDTIRRKFWSWWMTMIGGGYTDARRSQQVPVGGKVRGPEATPAWRARKRRSCCCCCRRNVLAIVQVLIVQRANRSKPKALWQTICYTATTSISIFETHILRFTSWTARLKPYKWRYISRGIVLLHLFI